MRVGVLGGGLVGLAVAAHSRHDCTVLEADEVCGGHCRSLVKDGYTFDLGGPHILFSRDEKILEFMLRQLGDNVTRQRRNNKIYFKGRYVKYPFENGLYDLDPQDRFECLFHYLNNSHPKPTNFREWILHNFGTGIADKYMIPYNEKIWNVPAEQMGIDWVEGRVPKPPAEDIIKAAVGVETEGYTHQLYFSYPHSGGIEALPKAFERRCRSITTGFPVRRVWREGSTWHVTDGSRTHQFDQIVSSIPVQALIRALPDVPADIVRRTAALKFNSLVTVMFGVRCEAPLPFTALYVPDTEYIYHRLSFPLNFTAEGAPAGHMAVTAEITTNPGDGIHELGDDAIIDKVLAGLEKMGIVHRDDVRFHELYRTEYAYVVRTFDYKQNLDHILSYLQDLGIISVGRNAEFEYINMDEAVRRALAIVERLDSGDSPDAVRRR
jgi:protoporphyrinogen oxidase